MRVLGVDPGVSETGWALLEGGRVPSTSQSCARGGAGRSKDARLLESGLIRTSARTPLPDRLKTIHEELDSLIREHRPEAMAVEQMFFMKAANTVRATLQARGVILLAASRNRTPVQEYNPRQVKISLTGSGAAPKVQMQRMVQAALGLPERLRPDDVADAAAIALCHLRSSRRKGLVVLDRIGGGGRA